jgi:hypothetical protein
MKRAWLIAAMLVLPTAAHADGLESRVMVIPVSGDAPKGLGAVVDDVELALADGARSLTPNVSLATASLADTAVIVGCEPTEASCLDAIAAALNVDQLLIAEVTSVGLDARVDVTAVTRDSEPVRREFVIHKASRAGDVHAVEVAVPVMLEAGETRKAEAAAKAHSDREVDRTTKPADPIPEPERARPSRSHGPLFAMGGGAALMVVGGVFWTLAANQQEVIDSSPTATTDDLERLASLEASARVRASVGNVMVIGGAVVAAVGLTWFVVDRRRGHGESEVQVAPTVVPGGAGVAVGGVW